MNRVLALDDDSCFALLEPGVTYFSLYEEIRNKGKKLWIDVPASWWWICSWQYIGPGRWLHTIR